MWASLEGGDPHKSSLPTRQFVIQEHKVEGNAALLALSPGKQKRFHVRGLRGVAASLFYTL